MYTYIFARYTIMIHRYLELPLKILNVFVNLLCIRVNNNELNSARFQ